MMSDDPVEIRSLCGAAELRLSERAGLVRAPGLAYFRATLRKTDIVGSHTQVSASTKIPAYGPQGELTRFFEGMAADRAGWEGEKSWESVGAILTLRGTLYTSKDSGRGEETRVLMEVVLKSCLDDWWVQAGLSLGLGQLEEAAAEVRRFFSAMPAT
jgi:Family of unknown function (DUF6228)